MPFSNSDAAAVFSEIGDLLEVQGANACRVRAYRNAARVLAGLGHSVKDMLDAGEDLDALPGIGKDLAGKIAEIVDTGTCAQLDELRRKIPSGVTQLLQLPGLGPRRAQALFQELGVASLEQLREAAEQGRVRGVRGFSADAERRLLGERGASDIDVERVIGHARQRGWLEAAGVLNTRPLDKLRPLLAATMDRAIPTEAVV